MEDRAPPRRAGRPFLPEDVRKEFEGFQILDNNWNLPGVIQQEDNCAKVRTDTKKGRCLRQVVLATWSVLLSMTKNYHT